MLTFSLFASVSILVCVIAQLYMYKGSWESLWKTHTFLLTLTFHELFEVPSCVISVLDTLELAALI